jgi:hypothetical protein
MGDTVVLLKHAGRRVISGADSDIPSEPWIFITRLLVNLTVQYRISERCE